MLTVKRRLELTPHCETVFPNHKCSYLDLGCTGCKMLSDACLFPKFLDADKIKKTNFNKKRGLKMKRLFYLAQDL